MGHESDEALFAQLYPGLRSFAAVVGDDDMEPEDIVQDVLLATLSRTSLTELENPGAYLRASIVHRVASTRRSLGTRRAFKPLLDADAKESATDSYSIELDGLLPDDPIDRAVLWLTAIEGHTSHEAADIVGLSSAAVRKRLSRIRSNHKRKSNSKQSRSYRTEQKGARS